MISLIPPQALVAPDKLEGVRLVLRISAGAPRAEWGPSFDDLRKRGGHVGFHALGIPDETDPILDASGDVLLIQVAKGEVDSLAFALKRVFARARGVNGRTTLVLASNRELLSRLVRKDLGAYVDGFLALDDSPDPVIAGTPVSWRPARGEGGAIATIASISNVINDRGVQPGQSRVWLLSPDALQAHAVLRDLGALQAWLPAGLVSVPDRQLACGSVNMPTFLNPQTLDLIGIAGGCAPSAPIRADVEGLTVDPLQLDDVLLVRARGEAGDRFAEAVRVTGARALSVEEIIARHQAAAARQAADVRTDIATGSLTITFEAPGFPAPVTITSHTIIFRSPDRTELQQQDIRVNGVSFRADGGVPRLPIIEPERVAAPPLAITLTEAYRYRLAGRETIAGRLCYIVAFEPRSRRDTLYEGRAWIAADTFALVRVSAVQTELRGPVTASEQTDEFQQTADGHWLLARSDVRQTYEGAAVRTPIHRLLVFERHEVNASDFDRRRARAYGSGDVMLRDTPQGFCYLARRPSPEPGATTTEPVVAGRAERIRTLAFGVIVDPNISRPLPFAGLSYVDFNLLGTGAQLNAFFGGSYGQLAFSAPSLGGTRWQLGGRAFGIAASYNDRAFLQGREQYGENIRQRPAEAAVWLLHPLSPRTTVRAGYQWDYTKFGPTELTRADFRVPANQVVHAALLSLDVQRTGWQMSLWWRPAIRAGWRPWGSIPGEDYRPSQHDFQRFGATAVRSVAVNPRLATRIELGWMSGHDLDRFSRYSFGTFDNRLRGYPSALIRYDRGAVVRTAIAWAAAKAVRIDGFVDSAEVHDPGFGRGLRNYTGFGAAIEAPAPFGTLWAVEWGYGLRGIRSDGRVGTHVVRVTGYKVF